MFDGSYFYILTLDLPVKELRQEQACQADERMDFDHVSRIMKLGSDPVVEWVFGESVHCFDFALALVGSDDLGCIPVGPVGEKQSFV